MCHALAVLCVAQNFALLGHDDLRLVRLGFQLTLFDLEYHGGKGAVHSTVAIAASAVFQGLLRGAVEQDRNVYADIAIAVAMRPLDNQDMLV